MMLSRIKATMIILNCFIFSSFVHAWDGGNGSAATPWQIDACSDLNDIGNDATHDLDDYYELTTDLDCEDECGRDSRDGNFWIDGDLSGSFDGQGHVISHLDVYSTRGVGLIYKVYNSGVIKNVGVVNSVFESTERQAGAIASKVDNASILRCYTSGTSVIAEEYAGGIVGIIEEDATISNSYSGANVSGRGAVGGISAILRTASINNCYATGNVTDLVGANEGGLFVNIDGSPSVTCCYWDMQATGQSSTAGGYGTGKTTAQMKQEATFTNWDFSGTWSIVEDHDYPRLTQFVDAGLVAHYHLDETSGTVADDESDCENDGTLLNGPVWTTGISGNGLSFDGTNDYVSCGTDASLDLTTAFTLSVWFKTSMEASAGLIDKSVTSDTYRSYRLHKTSSSDAIQFSISSTGSDWIYIIGTTEINDNEWHHALGVYDGTTERMELYIDGVEEGSVTGTVPSQIHTNALDVEIGRTNGSYCMDGIIDEVKIFNRALSAQEISNLYVQFAPSSLISYWDFDDGSGTTADDAIGTNDGTLINGPTWTTGINDGGLSFDGTNDYVSCGTNASLDLTTAFTLSVWFKTSMEASAGLIDKSLTSGTSRAYRLHKTSSSDAIQFSISSTGSDWIYIAGTTEINDDEWHHALGVYDGTTERMELYIDGVEEGSVTGTVPSQIHTNALDVEIGRTNGSYCMDGVIDEVKIFNRALSYYEIVYLAESMPLSKRSLNDAKQAPQTLLPVAADGHIVVSGSNPFISSTAFTYTVPVSDRGLDHVCISIYDINGGLVSSLVNEMLVPGTTHSITWDAGENLGTGIYYYEFSSGDMIKTGVLMRR